MTGRTGILGYGTHIPYWRMHAETLAEAVGSGKRSGTRAVASYDEDTTTMAAQAARACLGSFTEPTGLVDSLFFATARPVYADKTNASAIHAALGLPPDILAADMTGAVRCASGALLGGLRGSGGTLVALSDIRTGWPGGDDERTGGDGAAAFLLGESGANPLIAEYLGGTSVTDEFLDRWRAPGEAASQQWEERFGQDRYPALAGRAFDNALKDTGLTTDQLDRVAVAGLAPRAARAFTHQAGLAAEALVADQADRVGNTGTAHPGLMLAAALDTAAPNQIIALVVLADGADVLVFRTTEALVAYRPRELVADQMASGSYDLSYPDFLAWRGMVTRQPPRRPDPDRAAAPAAHRMAAWKFGFTASRCETCGTRHLPPQRVCMRCGATDRMGTERLADTPGVIATYTVDHLAYSPSPPVIAAVIDFDGGGRFQCELTDVDPDAVAIGDRVEMTFRRLSTTDGIHNYFWKARPMSGGPQA